MSKWEDRRAATVAVGAVTPAGPVESVEYFGALRLVELTVAGVTYSRGFDELVSVAT